MNTNNKLSVIIPTYYRHKELPNILCCLENQTYAPEEIIIVDQTPLDEVPLGFYEAYQDRLPLKVIMLDTPSSTISRNLGAKKAKGDLFCFFDDKIEGNEDLIESHVKVMFEQNVDVVHGATIHSKLHGSRLPGVPLWGKEIKNFDPALIFLISPNYQWSGMAIGLNTANMCIKKEAFLKSMV